ncbi:MAG: DUF1385 domain-containing protein [Candidatus Wallbacteria bacterium]|nr:DUF1385 domain-containing protein [Candidatus Wallbacteria bacterium]
MPELRKIGGQAVIEGVMLRGKQSYSIAVKGTDDSIFTFCDTYKWDWVKTMGIEKIPLIRGVVMLLQSIWLGIRSLGLSAAIQSGEKEAKISNWELVGSMLTAFSIGTVICILLPFAAAGYTGRALDLKSMILFNIIEGVCRFAVFVAYLWLITKIPEVERVLAYHGAEHKTVNAYEKGLELNLLNVKTCSRFHPRCGTSFILFFIICASVVFSVFPVRDLLGRVVMRVLLVPLLAGISYELISLSSRFSPRLSGISGLGIYLQRLTTREPDDGQIEVAMVALHRLLQREA